MNEYYSKGYNEGVKIACALNRRKVGDAISAKTFNDTVLEDHYMQHALCKLASSIMYAAGEEYSPEGILYTRLANFTEMGGKLSKVASESIIGPVVESLSDGAVSASAIAFEKVAGAGDYVELGKNSLGALLTMACFGGTSIGALAWLLNRNSNVYDSEIDTKIEQAKHYRQIANDIKEKLKTNTAELKDTAKSMGEGSYVL